MSIVKITMPKGQVDYKQVAFDDVRLFCNGERLQTPREIARATHSRGSLG
jgi:hypothetical protein